MRYRVKHTDIAGRWQAGEIGEEIANDFPEKYAHKLDFGILELAPGTVLFGKPMQRYHRVGYFQADEVERVPPDLKLVKGGA